MLTFLSLLLGVVGIFVMLAGDSGIGLLLLIISALIFIRGHRIRREREEKRWRQEMLDASRK